LFQRPICSVSEDLISCSVSLLECRSCKTQNSGKKVSEQFLSFISLLTDNRLHCVDPSVILMITKQLAKVLLMSLLSFDCFRCRLNILIWTSMREKLLRASLLKGTNSDELIKPRECAWDGENNLEMPRARSRIFTKTAFLQHSP
jgi:hypothetical protein